MRSNSDEQCREEAALWAARLEGGGMTDATRLELQTWLDQSPEHLAALTRIRSVSARVSPKLVDVFTSLDATKERRIRRRTRLGWYSLTLAAAALAVGFLIQTSPKSFQTAIAERRIVELSDGTRVTLNAKTELRVKISGDQRRVSFKSGEAVFNVAKDPHRPFIVESEAGTIVVTGTAFNVRLIESERAEVTVLEGTVELQSRSTSAPPARLTSDEQGVIIPTAVTVKALPDGSAVEVSSWQNGELVFRDTPLVQALERFARYHGKTVHVSTSAADHRLGGRYQLSDLTAFLNAVSTVADVHIVKTGDEIFVRPNSAR